MTRRFRSRVLSLVAGALMVPTLSAAQAQRRDLHVSVVDKAGMPVKEMQVEDFIVREDNLAREVLAVRPLTEPLDIALLVDNTQASSRETAILRTALSTFVRELGNDHRYALITFGERPTLVADNVTGAEDLIARGVNRLFPLANSGSYLLDAILETAQGFRKREAAHPVIVAISFEGPELSYTQYPKVLDLLRDSGTSLFVVTVNIPNSEDFNTQERQSREIVYSRGTRESGGRLETALSSLGLEQELKQLAAVLKQRYIVTYGRPETLIPPKKVEITAKRPNLDVRGLQVKTGGSK